MELQKAEKIRHVLLVILNACLAVLNYQQNRESAMNASQEKAIFEVLFQKRYYPCIQTSLRKQNL